MYPDIRTEFANMKADAKGVASSITLDDGTRYSITNRIAELHPDATYRVVCGYVPSGQQATLYTLEGAHILRDSTQVAQSHPTGVLSAWRSGNYINLHLTPRTQGGTHYWGFCIDSLTEHHAHLSLHHHQNGDPTSYSTTTYASLPVDSIAGIAKGDTITLHINTFKGRREWKMMY